MRLVLPYLPGPITGRFVGHDHPVNDEDFCNSMVAEPDLVPQPRTGTDDLSREEVVLGARRGCKWRQVLYMSHRARPQ
jgi:hypothetical protein